MRPWKAIPVAAYMPLAEGLLSKGFSVVADKTDEAAWELAEWEKQSLREPLEEALQRAIYDLKLAGLATNPYVQIVLAVGGLATVKYAAIEARKAMDRKEAQRRSQLPQNQRSTQPELPTENIKTPASGVASSSAGFQMPASPFSYDNGSGEDDAS